MLRPIILKSLLYQLKVPSKWLNFCHPQYSARAMVFSKRGVHALMTVTLTHTMLELVSQTHGLVLIHMIVIRRVLVTFEGVEETQGLGEFHHGTLRSVEDNSGEGWRPWPKFRITAVVTGDVLPWTEILGVHHAAARKGCTFHGGLHIYLLLDSQDSFVGCVAVFVSLNGHKDLNIVGSLSWKCFADI
jgi:hypothetical protein